jgi:pyruvate/2-oxoglutarate dehydrogenase complex dihydrolipoamide dehydrogenase (E3) component
MDDAFAFQHHLVERPPQRLVIVGGGYIGLEIADARTHRGIQVTVVEFMPRVMTTVDPSLGELLGAELRTRGVEVHTRTAVEAIEQAGGRLSVRTARGAFAADMVLVSVGAVPRTDLASSAGIETGIKGAFKVNRRMETSVPHVFAAGDCVETWHRLLNGYTYLPLGTTAHKQGRIAGENAVGGSRAFAGSLGT